MSDVSTSTLICGARLADADGITDDGWLLLRGGRIVRRGMGDPGIAADRVHNARGRLVCPGFVDIHTHGGGGRSGEGDLDDILDMAAFHRRHGTTSLAVSLATAPWELLVRRVATIRDAARIDDRVLGTHLEGPFLDHAHRGAHDPSLLRRPTAALVTELLDVADGTLRQITLAPEHADDEVLDLLLDAGVRVAVGHTSATSAQAGAAFARGATILTHAFNGMPGIHHRAPGPVMAAALSGATLEIIADGVHVDPGVISLAFSLAPGRIALVTDAIAAAGAADGQYPLGGHIVTVHGGIARIGENGSLAGSTLTLDRAIRVCVDAGIGLVAAIAAATRVPAETLGERSRGTLDVGGRADLVELDSALEVTAVWTRGRRE